MTYIFIQFHNKNRLSLYFYQPYPYSLILGAMYSIVIFDEENTTEGVPSKWIKKISNENFCYWPLRLKREKIAKMIKANADPSTSSWNLLKCRIKFEAQTYEEMKIKAMEAEVMSSQVEASDSESQSMIDNSRGESSSCASPSPPCRNKKRKGLLLR